MPVVSVLQTLCYPSPLHNFRDGIECHAEPFASLRGNSAKHLWAHRERPFPFAALRASAHFAQGDTPL